MTEKLLALTGQIVVAHASLNEIATIDLPILIRSTYNALHAGKPAGT
jgi:predicted transcriptional regulator